MTRVIAEVGSAVPLWFWVVCAGVLGLVMGSFVSAVAARVPAGESLMTRSHCPVCLNQIRSRDNVPLLSWLLLRGKCRDCQAGIPARYPLLELSAGVAFAALTWIMVPQVGAFTLVLLAFAACCLALAVIDWQTYTLPNVIVAVATVVAVTGVLVRAAATSDWGSLLTPAVAGFAYGAFYFMIFVGTRGRGLGFGDVKLAPCLGVMAGSFGAGAAAVGFVAPFLLAGPPLAILMATGVLKRGTRVPFGPFLIAGAWVGILVGAPVFDLYLSFFGTS